MNMRRHFHQGRIVRFEEGSMLDRMDVERIFYIVRLDTGAFEVTEGCDSAFSVELSANELRQLGQELIDLAAG